MDLEEKRRKNAEYARRFYRRHKERLEKENKLKRKIEKNLEVLKTGNFEKRGVLLTINGQQTFGYRISTLAKFLNRKTGTMRNWINAGMLPDTGLRSSKNGRLFLYEHIYIVREEFAKACLLGKKQNSLHPACLWVNIQKRFAELHKAINDGTHKFEFFDRKKLMGVL